MRNSVLCVFTETQMNAKLLFSIMVNKQMDKLVNISRISIYVVHELSRNTILDDAEFFYLRYYSKVKLALKFLKSQILKRFWFYWPTDSYDFVVF